MNTVPSRPKSSLKREFSRREELPPRSRVVADYGPPPPPPRSTSERSSSYRDSYPTRGPTYADLPRGSSHPSSRRAPASAAYTDGGYPPRYERPPPPSYRERPPRDYDPVPGSKRSYAALVRTFYYTTLLLFIVVVPCQRHVNNPKTLKYKCYKITHFLF